MPLPLTERHKRAARHVACQKKMLGVRIQQIKVLTRWIREREKKIAELEDRNVADWGRREICPSCGQKMYRVGVKKWEELRIGHIIEFRRPKGVWECPACGAQKEEEL